MPFFAPFASLPWTVANIAWCMLSLACFALSVLALLRNLLLSGAGKCVAASICLFFSPTYVGVINGNPSVVSIGLTILSLHFAIHKRPWMSGVLFGVALCLKPQIAACALLAMLLWKCWASLTIGFTLSAIASLAAILQASSFCQNWNWFASLRQNLATASAPGGLADARPASPFASGFLNAQTFSYLISNNSRIAEGIVLVTMLALLVIYFYCSSKKNTSPGQKWVDAAFFATITLAAAYHRYYDAQLLLVLIPAVIYLWQTGRTQMALLLSACFLLLAFPFHSTLERVFGPPTTAHSLVELILFRYESLTVLVLSGILGFSAVSARMANRTQPATQSPE